MLRWSGWIVVGTMLAAAAYELVLALRHVPSPSEGGVLLVVGLLAMLVAGVLAFAGVGPVWMYAPAAALFTTARYFTGDPYYGTTFRTYSDGGIVPAAWIFVLLVLAVVAGAATLFRRRAGNGASGAVIVLLLLTALYMGTGH